MKKILFLLLFPCLAMAQYPGNAGQKITLGEQTTADGLVFRGVASIDTVTATSKITRANKQDTSAFILLDTVTNLLWHYNTGSNAWIQAGGSKLDTATMLLPYYRAGRNTIIQAADVPTLNQNTTGSAATLTTGRTIQTNLASTSAATFNGSANITPGVTGVLPVANGGTNTSTLTANKVMVGNGTSGVLTPNHLQSDNTNGRLYIGLRDSIIAKPNTVNAPLVLQSNSGGSTIHFLGRAAGSNSLFAFYKYNGDSVMSFIVVRETEFGFETRNSTHFAFRLSQFHGGSEPYEKMRINVNGVGINTSLPSQALHVVGNARITAVGSGTFANNLNITSDGTLTTATSDEKYKYNILPISYGLNTILQLKPVNFQWIKGEENDLGFIAQDVADIIPEAVDTNWNSDLLMRYESIIPILTKAIQEQQALIKALEQRLLTLENK